MHLLIGIDDTDNKDSRGTGFKARQLAKLIVDESFGQVIGVTRHQLFIHDAIAYTSQNSSACLEVFSDATEPLQQFCAAYLKQEAAEGSDAGLCLAVWEEVDNDIVIWGRAAKREILNLEGASWLADKKKIYLEGFTGEKIGQIGALAAVGLRKSGNDGRFISLYGSAELRDFDSGIYTVSNLMESTGIKSVETIAGERIQQNDRIFCSGWTRPVLKNNLSVLLVEKVNFADYEWKTVDKEYVRKIS